VQAQTLQMQQFFKSLLDKPREQQIAGFLSAAGFRPNPAQSAAFDAIRELDFTRGAQQYDRVNPGNHDSSYEDIVKAAEQMGATLRGTDENGGNSHWGVDNGRYAWSANWDGLKDQGFQSKYNVAKDLGNNRIQVTFQNPGKHKYDTLEAIYELNPETGKGRLLQTKNSRQQSSWVSFRESIHDSVDIGAKFGALAAATYGAALGPGALGSAIGLSGTAATVGGSALLGASSAANAGARGGDIWKAGLTSAGMAGLGQLAQGSETFRALPAPAQRATMGGASSLVRGGDPRDALMGAISGGLTTNNRAANVLIRQLLLPKINEQIRPPKA
jgi:hypothetical protein